MASEQMAIQVHVTGNRITRVSNKTGKPYTNAEAYASIPGVLYPQRFTFYCETEQQVPAAGVYACHVELSVKNDNLDFRCDPRQGRRIADAPSQKQSA